MGVLKLTFKRAVVIEKCCIERPFDLPDVPGQGSPASNYPRVRIMLKKRRLNGLLSVLAVASSLAVALPLIRQQAPATAGENSDAIALQFCLTNTPEARVTPADKVDRHYSVDVPLETPLVGMPSAAVHSIAKGEVVQFEVVSPRPGQVAVHGLLDAETVQVGSVLSVAFRAVYTGRFPLHFHGADGSHFEIAALEVLPMSMVTARSKGQ